MVIEGALKATGWPASAEKLAAAMSNLKVDLKGLRGGPIEWTKDNHFRTRQRSRLGSCVAEPRGAGHAGRPRAAVAVGVKEHGQTRRYAHRDGTSDQRRYGGQEFVKLGYSRQSNRKADEGSRHPDRDAQFEHINAKVIAAQAGGQPVISVDTKKKELIGNFRNGGSDYRPKGEPLRVNVHDFEDKTLGKVVPYGRL